MIISIGYITRCTIMFSRIGHLVRSYRYALPISCLLSCPVFAESEVFKLVYPEFKPYQYSEGGDHKGIGLDALRSIMAELELEYTVESMPSYRRAEMEVSNGFADGFFLASRNDARDRFAEFSEPLLINNWVWVFRRTDVAFDVDTEGFKQDKRVSTVLHTNTHTWLRQNGYKNISALLQPKLLPQLLDLSRTDSIFMAEAVFWFYVDQEGYARDKFSVEIEYSKPFGLYISKRYIESHPEFMAKLNEAIVLSRASVKQKL